MCSYPAGDSYWRMLPWLEMQTVVPPASAVVQVTTQSPRLAGLWPGAGWAALAHPAFDFAPALELAPACPHEIGTSNKMHNVTRSKPFLMGLPPLKSATDLGRASALIPLSLRRRSIPRPCAS